MPIQHKHTFLHLKEKIESEMIYGQPALYGRPNHNKSYLEALGFKSCDNYTQFGLARFALENKLNIQDLYYLLHKQLLNLSTNHEFAILWYNWWRCELENSDENMLDEIAAGNMITKEWIKKPCYETRNLIGIWVLCNAIPNAIQVNQNVYDQHYAIWMTMLSQDINLVTNTIDIKYPKKETLKQIAEYQNITIALLDPVENYAFISKAQKDKIMEKINALSAQT